MKIHVTAGRLLFDNTFNSFCMISYSWVQFSSRALSVSLKIKMCCNIERVFVSGVMLTYVMAQIGLVPVIYSFAGK